MDEKKVREAIEELVEWLEDYEDALNRCIKGSTKGIKESIQNIKTAIEALEKQLPKKPMYEGDGFDQQGNIVLDTWICPNCESEYEVEYDNYCYCCNCGQRIDLSEQS